MHRTKRVPVNFKANIKEAKLMKILSMSGTRPEIIRLNLIIAKLVTYAGKLWFIPVKIRHYHSPVRQVLSENHCPKAL